MMIHEKMVSGQFLLDFKNERSNLLNGHHSQHQHNLNELHPQHHHQQHAALATHYLHLNHHHQQLAQQTMQHQPPSPPMEIYAAYAYQQQQQQLMNNAMKLNHNINDTNEAKVEVLDLSRRCDSVETPRKTPSPTHTNSSVGTASPISSPQQQQTSLIPSNLLYSAHAQQQQQKHQMTMPPAQVPATAAATLPAALATLYPALYYSNNIIKLETKSPNDSPNKTPSPLPAPASQTTSTTSPTPIFNNSNVSPMTSATDLLHTFATAAKSPSINTTTTTPPPALAAVSNSECQSPSTTNKTMSHLNMLTTLEEKNTRPFKALPRDPLVIAANFAATDVLFENHRAERYKEFRKRLLEHIHSSNGGSRTVTNPKMRRTNSRSVVGSACRSSSEERQDDQQSSKADESMSDCDSNAGSFTDMKLSGGLAMTSSTSSSGSLEGQNNTNTSCGGIVKDAAYLERRRKNNAAAKKSRDRRRIKEDELAMRAEFLAQENVELVCQIKALKAQLAAYTSKVGA